MVCLDETGKLVHNENIYPHPPRNEYKQAAAKVTNMVATYDIQAIAIGMVRPDGKQKNYPDITLRPEGPGVCRQ